MRKFLTTAMAVALVSATSYADLQNIEVGGSIRVRGNAYYGDDAGIIPSSTEFTEQRTTLRWSADFTDEVGAVIELDNYGIWGTATRDAIGTAGAGTGLGAVSLYQGYIELGEAWGSAVDVRIGRQEIQLGSEFLVGNNDTASIYTGLSFDGVTAAYNADTFSITGIAVKLAEVDIGGGVDADTDMYGVYSSYTGQEDMVVDAYWLYIRTGLPGVSDHVELHTLGARVAGTASQFDYEAEVAFQTGDVGNGADYDGIAVNTEFGYTFDSNLQPRLFGGATLLEGPDSNGGDQGFNRLFSDWEYSEFLSNTDLTNIILGRLGISLQATEKIGITIVATHFTLDEEDAGSLVGADGGGLAADGSEDVIGQELGFYLTYAYSDDVSMEFGAAHFFPEEDFWGAGADDDANYLTAEISISF